MTKPHARCTTLAAIIVSAGLGTSLAHAQDPNAKRITINIRDLKGRTIAAADQVDNLKTAVQVTVSNADPAAPVPTVRGLRIQSPSPTATR